FAETKQPTTAPPMGSASTAPSTAPMMMPPQPTVTSPEPLVEPPSALVNGPAPNEFVGNGPRSVPMGCPYLPGQSGTPFVCGVDCGHPGAPCCATWNNAHCIPWSLFGPGEYVGPARPEHVSTYYLRVNDLITLTFITSRKKEA